jgi:hypothetical protein
MLFDVVPRVAACWRACVSSCGAHGWCLDVVSGHLPEDQVPATVRHFVKIRRTT